jgi:hypothetical protein
VFGFKDGRVAVVAGELDLDGAVVVEFGGDWTPPITAFWRGYREEGVISGLFDHDL